MERRAGTQECAMFLEKITRSRPPQSAPRTELLHVLFERQADACPHAVAVLFEGNETSYRDLERHANRIARHLRRRGVGRGTWLRFGDDCSIGACSVVLYDSEMQDGAR